MFSELHKLANEDCTAINTYVKNPKNSKVFKQSRARIRATFLCIWPHKFSPQIPDILEEYIHLHRSVYDTLVNALAFSNLARPTSPCKMPPLLTHRQEADIYIA